MADNKSGSPAPATAGQAINRVLGAERDAAQAIADCEAEARDIVQAARQRANRIAARADERITLIQMRCAKQVASTLRQLAAAQQTADGDPAETLDVDDINACLQQLAEVLTSADGEPDDGQ